VVAVSAHHQRGRGRVRPGRVRAPALALGLRQHALDLQARHLRRARAALTLRLTLSRMGARRTRARRPLPHGAVPLAAGAGAWRPRRADLRRRLAIPAGSTQRALKWRPATAAPLPQAAIIAGHVRMQRAAALPAPAALRGPPECAARRARAAAAAAGAPRPCGAGAAWRAAPGRSR